MHEKTRVRVRRGKRARLHMRTLGAHRLTVHRTAQHIYAQIIAPDAKTTLAAVSTLDQDVAKGLKSTSNTEAAKKIGSEIARRAKEKGVTKVAFDRSGFKYHGRVKALADAAREGGLEF
ncbi:MAG TPA: 50S ribosomal protein L18 [Candidatus Binatia bacterium]|nr:50S ribosomal protein L18 [Candidatus Binatia bacterium]